jgi:UDP-2-acetamido-3-amino-2,3-dideoxy-glucuronate N-acetyltransferase
VSAGVRPLRVGVFGLGEEGWALARHLSELPDADLGWIGDPVLPARARLRPGWPVTRATSTYEDLLEDGELEAVVVAVPPAPARGELVRTALEAGKHVVVTVPLALRAVEAEALYRLAAHRERQLLVANPLLFHPAVRKLRELVELGRIGEVRHLRCESRRAGAGAGVIASLGAPFVSLILYLLGDEPVAARAWRGPHGADGDADVASCLLTFAGGAEARLGLSRVDPQAAAHVAVVGSRRSAVFDELAERPLTIYERAGDVVSPLFGGVAPLRLSCEHAIASIRSPSVAAADPRRAVAVAATVEALSRYTPRQAAPPREPAYAGSSPDVVPLRAHRPRA